MNERLKHITAADVPGNSDLETKTCYAAIVNACEETDGFRAMVALVNVMATYISAGPANDEETVEARYNEVTTRLAETIANRLDNVKVQ